MKARFAAGLAVQVFASATNFALSILTGHAAGPSGLGTVYAGFAAYAATLGLQRAFVTTPLISSTTTTSGGQKAEATSAALTLVVTSSVLASVGFGVAGVLLGGTIGTGLVLFAPWLVPALTQQFWRAAFFRDDRTRRAVVNDFVWFAVLMAIAPLALRAGSERAVVIAWGLGSLAAAVLALNAVRPRIVSLRKALRWWRREASSFGSWLALQETVFIVVGFVLVAVMAEILGGSDLGGMRAAESVFAPISLIAPAILLPGLPAMARARRRTYGEARSLAVRLSSAALLLTSLYFVAMIVLSENVLGWVFGSGFSEYDFLVWPMGLWQMAAAAAIGFSILLQAEQRGKALTAAGVLGSVSGLVLVSLFALNYGVSGAAWGLTLAAMLSTSATIVLALRQTARAT
jgi:O-antigen/teichoic acid export membrane protein